MPNLGPNATYRAPALWLLLGASLLVRSSHPLLAPRQATEAATEEGQLGISRPQSNGKMVIGFFSLYGGLVC